MRLNLALLSQAMQKSGGHTGTVGTTNHGAGWQRPHNAANDGDTRGHSTRPSPMSPDAPPARGTAQPSTHELVPDVPIVPTQEDESGNAQNDAIVLAWLEQIGETDPLTIADALRICRKDATSMQYVTARVR